MYVIMSVLCITMLLVQGEEEGGDFGLGGGGGKSVGGEDCRVVVLVGLAEFRWHGLRIVEVGEGRVRVEVPGVKDGLGGSLNPLDHLQIGSPGLVSVWFTFSDSR